MFYAVFVRDDCPKDFTLYCNIKRRALNCAPIWYKEFGSSVSDPDNILTFEEEGFCKNAVIHIQENAGIN